MQLISLAVAVLISVALFAVFARGDSTPNWWKLLGALAGGMGLSSLITPLITDTTYRSVLVSWIAFGPLLLLISFIVWLKAMAVARRRNVK
jgi:hypothetical protein